VNKTSLVRSGSHHVDSVEQNGQAMTNVDSISGQRVAFWQGQWFDAAGLRNAMANDALMLGWHLRGCIEPGELSLAWP